MVEFRGFIAIDVPVSESIIKIEEEIRDSGAVVKLVEPKNIHITLKFLGDTSVDLVDDITSIIKDSIAEVGPFKIKLADVGAFPNLDYIKVMWIGLQNFEGLIPIYEKIDSGCVDIGFKKEKRGFSPHLTIARVKSARNKDRLVDIIGKNKNTVFSEFLVDSIKLKKSVLTSDGPIYSNVAEVGL